MTQPARAKTDDVARIVAGAIKGGMEVGRVEVAPDGKIAVYSASVAPAEKSNPWDECLGKA